MTVIEKEAKEKWCPFTQKHCKGTECMLFEYAGEKIRDIRGDANTVSNKSEQPPIFKVYKCGVLSVPVITLGDMSVPANMIGEKK